MRGDLAEVGADVTASCPPCAEHHCRMPFARSVKEEALVRSRRCCCLCNGFAGRYAYVHHIVQEAEGGSNDLDNTIVLCDSCHGDVRHYAPEHPIGNRYRPEELRRLRDAWWAYMEQNPVIGLPRHPLTLSPSMFALPVRPGEAELSVLDLTNTSTDVLYSTVIGIVFPPGPADTWHVTWGDPPIDYWIELGEHGARWNLGLFVIGATISSTGQELLLFLLGRLPPGHHQVEMQFRSDRPPESDDAPRASVHLLDFSLDHPRLVQRPSPTDAGWQETLLRVRPFDEYMWIGLSSSPSGRGERASEDGPPRT